MSRSSVPRSTRQYTKGLNSEALRLARSLPGAKEQVFPDFIEPSLATLAPRPPRGEQWVHEVKYDGYRFQCHIHRDTRFYTRRGHDWSEQLIHLVRAVEPIASHAVVLDGEVIVQTPDGHSDFHALEKELGRGRLGSPRLLRLRYSVPRCILLRAAPFIDRKRILTERMTDVHGPIKLSEHNAASRIPGCARMAAWNTRKFVATLLSH